MTLNRLTAASGFGWIVLFVFGTSVAATEAEHCFGDWSNAARIVKREQLVTVAELASKARNKIDGAIVRTSLCHEDGRYIYKLVIRDHRGQLRRKSVDARSPF